ncbi:PP2C family protein-serine/threonine phosphatase [Microbispora sp. ATCC PTA-5024]|uniref:PP2C family protein-serine/threonine phosphatase n=1 Tax=Microbispora sp. ATCC PTA-5024 TaxID=316330 RepID=UPI001E4D8F35|nr:PP2C family protein-serine/threonine phosphatase [Microbispora sp. ATCC PTA-5024]
MATALRGTGVAMRGREAPNETDGGLLRTLTELLETSHRAAVEDLPAMVGASARRAGLGDVQIYLIDLQQNVLRRLRGRHFGGGAPLETADAIRALGSDAEQDEIRVDTTLAGRAFQEVRTLAKTGPGDRPEHWWVPLVDGSERIGVLRVAPAGDDEGAIEAMQHLASLLSLLLVSKGSFSDTYARIVRSRPMNVAAELQWNLMPPLTFSDSVVTIAGMLEPAYEIGGDAFDYSIAGTVAHLAIFDAMGHDVSAGLTANLAVAACRNNRRQGIGLTDNSEQIEQVLIEEFGKANRFVTAILADLDTTTGTFTWVNRGHHPPVVIRRGRWIATLQCPPAHPMGLGLGLPVTLCREQLEPGDRVLLYTDGITELRTPGGTEFGLPRFVDFVIRQEASGLPVPETLRRLTRAVLDYHDHRLDDDATVLFVEWHGPPQRLDDEA